MQTKTQQSLTHHSRSQQNTVGQYIDPPLYGVSRVDNQVHQQQTTKKSTSNSTQSLKSSHSITQPVVQRYTDVNSVNFDHAGEPAFVAKAADLANYSQVQQFLSDLRRTKPHLDVLNTNLLFGANGGLSGQLSHEAELDTGKDANVLPKLIGFVPPADFAEMTQSNTIFEDWVDAAHGVQTHRIQWHMIAQEFGGIARGMYEDASNPIWDTDQGLHMWDLVVDTTVTNQAHDFTKPERLENYLSNSYKPRLPNLIDKIRQLRNPEFQNPLRQEINTGKQNFLADKGQLEAWAPILEQEDKPDEVNDEHGRWDGWISSTEYAGAGAGAVRVKTWKPTIFQPA